MEVMVGFHKEHSKWLKHLVHVSDSGHVDEVSVAVQGDGTPHHQTRIFLTLVFYDAAMGIDLVVCSRK